MKTSLFVATPMYGGMCSGPYAASIANLMQVFMHADIPIVYDTKYNQSLITRARDSLADDFMSSDCSHLLFIDADIQFDPNDILTMIKTDKDVLCGVYPRKRIQWEQVADAVKSGVPASDLHYYSGSFPVIPLEDTVTVPADNDHDSPIEVRAAAAGFMLIKRSVFETLATKVPHYLSNTDDQDNYRYFKQYFDTSIDPDSESLLSEDYTFCRLVRENGFHVWIAPWVRLTHIGTFPFRGTLLHD